LKNHKEDMVVSDTVLNFDDISDVRYNPFTGVYTPKLVGYGSISPELRTIPNSSPYIIKLFEQPQRNTPSTTIITLVSTSEILQEANKTQTLSNKQFKVNYDELDVGKVEFHPNQKGLQVSIKYYALGTINQKSAFGFQLNGVGNSITLASSDSLGTSKTIADSIITVGQDAGAVINSYIDSLNARGGGSIFLFEGNYTITTKIIMKSNVSIIGVGSGTILNKNANIDVIDVTDANNILLREFRIDGKKATYTGNGISGTAGPVLNARVVSVSVKNCTSNGFNVVNNVSTSYATGCAVGFQSCSNVVACFAKANTDGFKACTNVTGCRADSNTQDGFSGTTGYSSCRSISNTRYGFNGCFEMSACISATNGSHGFNNCDMLTACEANGNTGNGFDACKAMGFNRSAFNSSAYNNSFADWAGTQACADTATGGYNNS
jgi:hypothetical protein